MGGRMHRVVLLLALAAASPLAARADDAQGCAAFTWDMSREFAAMRAPAKLLPASANTSINPVRLKAAEHITATLLPEESVTFVAPPAHARKSEHATAGLLFFKTGRGGVYRISLTSHHWIDVFDGNQVIASRAHEGHGGCELLHKVVEFEFPANRDLSIQLSGDQAATVDLVVTAVEKQ
jgi:hypothetical protein